MEAKYQIGLCSNTNWMLKSSGLMMVRNKLRMNCEIKFRCEGFMGILKKLFGIDLLCLNMWANLQGWKVKWRLKKTFPETWYQFDGQLCCQFQVIAAAACTLQWRDSVYIKEQCVLWINGNLPAVETNLVGWARGPWKGTLEGEGVGCYFVCLPSVSTVI